VPAGAFVTKIEAAIGRGAYPEGTGKGERGLRRRVTGGHGGAKVSGQFSDDHLFKLELVVALYIGAQPVDG
jgi:hypothetical protein